MCGGTDSSSEIEVGADALEVSEGFEKFEWT